MSPFDILDVAEDADDAAVRAAYLRAIHRFPPSISPLQFSRVAAAYAHIESADKRLRYRVDGKPDCADGDLQQQAIVYGTFQRQRPDFADLKQSCIAHNRKLQQQIK